MTTQSTPLRLVTIVPSKNDILTSSPNPYFPTPVNEATPTDIISLILVNAISPSQDRKFSIVPNGIFSSFSMPSMECTKIEFTKFCESDKFDKL